jgi:hypothetical protein
MAVRYLDFGRSVIWHHGCVRWQSRDGRWRVDLIRLSHTADHRDGERFRLARDGYFQAECRTVAELAEFVDPAELEEA